MVFKSRFPDVRPDAEYRDLASNFFWSQLDKFGANVLFADHESRRQWTGAQIKQASARLAGQLIRHGLEPDDDCVIFHKHSDYTQLAALGVLFAGGSVCAGYDLDPEHEHAYMLALMRPAFVFAPRRLAPEMLKLRRGHKHRYTIVLMDDDSLADDDFRGVSSAAQVDTLVLGLHRDLLGGSDPPPEAPLPVQVDPQRPAFILLTSGSTGRPKPASRSQRNTLYVCHSLVGAEALWDLNESSVVAAHLALDHGTGIFLLKQCLTRGYKSVIIDGYTQDKMLDAIETHRITDLVLGSAFVHNLLSSSEIEADDSGHLRERLSSLRNVLAVGSPIASQQTVRQFMSRVPDCSVRQAFGMTETGFLSVVPRELALREPDLSPKIVGGLLPNVELKLVCREQDGSKRAESGVEREIGEFGQQGELYVRGPTVSPGYVGERFREQARESFDL
jgi:acyl-CoA synthetase (AMP-forming)/AMP-acid ligase II